MSAEVPGPGRPPRRAPGRWRRLAAVALLAAAAALVSPLAPSAQARITDPIEVVRATPGPATAIVVTGVGPGQDIRGLQPPTPITQPPLEPYPATDPAGYQAVGGNTRTIVAESVDDPALTAELYCIQIRVATIPGIGYENATWEEAEVQNLGYVAYILNNYYPVVDAPAGLTPNQQAAAVQAAIWYFTDGFVLSTGQELRDATAGIVADAQANGPLTEPPSPDVTITPPAAGAPVGAPAGPFVVAAENAAEVTVSVPAGATLYSDAAGTVPLANPSTVPSGTGVFVRGSGAAPEDVTLTARAAVTVPGASVYLYDKNSARPAAQTLILASTSELEAVAQATAEFFEAGQLSLTKAFLGDAVGQQGAAELTVTCDGAFIATLPVPAGSTGQTFSVPVPVGSTCEITEPTTGETTAVTVVSDAPQSVQVPAAGAAATVTDTVNYRPGGLTVTKVVTGDGAGLQGPITVTVDCGAALVDTVELPAGAAADSYVQSYEDLPQGTVCTVTETSSGESPTVEVTSDGPVTATVLPGQTVGAVLTNTVSILRGGLTVTKTVTGDGAGAQGPIVLAVDCGAALTDTVEVPAGAAAGQYVESFDGLPAGTVCTVTETASGELPGVEVEADGPVTVTIVANQDAAAAFTDTVTDLRGALVVTKAVAGDGAGLQGPIVLTVDCGTALAETVELPAGAPAGKYVSRYEDLLPGTVCTVTETATGAVPGVQVGSDGPVTVTIESRRDVQVQLTDTVTREQVGPTPKPPAGSGEHGAVMKGPGPTSPGALAYTGVPLEPLLWTGAVLLGAGVLLTPATRRRGRD